MALYIKINGELKKVNDGDYDKIECSAAEYNEILTYDNNTIYIVSQPDNSVKFYLGPVELSADGGGGSAMPTTVFSSITPGTNLYQMLSSFPLQNDFEIVLCYQNLSPSGVKYFAGALTNELGSFILYMTTNGIYFSIFYGHTWSTVYQCGIENQNAIIFSQNEQHFIKIQKTSSSLSISHSLNGTNYELTNSIAIDSATIGNIDDGFALCNSATYAGSFIPIQNFNLSNCYIKNNNQVVWGREF